MKLFMPNVSGRIIYTAKVILQRFFKKMEKTMDILEKWAKKA